jgi:cytochrome c oxidase cbb3-type subunit 1
MFYASAMAWLIIGTLLAGFVSFKLHTPDLFSDISFLTWGRVRPAHMNVMVYGWASMAGMGTAIWLMARLCRTVLRHPLLLVAGAGFGIWALLGERDPPRRQHRLSMARVSALRRDHSFRRLYAHCSWAVLMFRRGEQIYITQWYWLCAVSLVSALTAGQLMLFVVPVRVLQSAVGWW